MQVMSRLVWVSNPSTPPSSVAHVPMGCRSPADGLQLTDADSRHRSPPFGRYRRTRLGRGAPIPPATYPTRAMLEPPTQKASPRKTLSANADYMRTCH